MKVVIRNFGISLANQCAKHGRNVSWRLTAACITDDSPASVAAGYGSLSGSQTVTELFGLGSTVNSSTVAGTFEPAAVSLSGAARAVGLGPGAGGYFYGSVTGTLGFLVSAGTTAQFSYSAMFTGPPGSLEDNLTITSAAKGSIVLGCLGQLDSAGDSGCLLGSLPTTSTPLTSTTKLGTVYLAAGQYDLNFSLASGSAAGSSTNPGFSFGLTTVVPLPASFWLLLSGLGGLAVARRQRILSYQRAA